MCGSCFDRFDLGLCVYMRASCFGSRASREALAVISLSVGSPWELFGVFAGVKLLPSFSSARCDCAIGV